jgi:hypothetical protein
MELVIRTRDAMPGFVELVDLQVKQLVAEGSGVAVLHRPISKGLYRTVEKCLLKVPGCDILEVPIDVTKLLDVAGCLITCTTFVDMLAVMEAVYMLQDAAEVIGSATLAPGKAGFKPADYRGATIQTKIHNSADGSSRVEPQFVVSVKKGLTLQSQMEATSPVVATLPLGTKLEVHERLVVLATCVMSYKLVVSSWTRLRVTDAKTGLSGWITEELKAIRGNGGKVFFKRLMPLPLAPGETYSHTITSFGPAITTDNPDLRGCVGKTLLTVDGAVAATMSNAEISELLNASLGGVELTFAVPTNDWRVCRMKDTWTTLSKAGWRDYKVNVMHGGIVFEIQVVLDGMLKARSQLDGHASYNQFRFLSECISYIGGYDAKLLAASESTMLDDGRIGRNASADDKLEVAEQVIEALDEDVMRLKTENAELQDVNQMLLHEATEFKAEIAGLKQENATLKEGKQSGNRFRSAVARAVTQQPQ